MIEVTLPWPDDNSLNARKHWAQRSSAARTCELEGFAAAREVYSDYVNVPASGLQANVVFFPPNKRRRDLDNMLARIKKHIDGICRAWVIDDACIKQYTLAWGEVTPGGKVVIKFEERKEL